MKANGLDKFYDPTYVYDLSRQYHIDPGFAMAVFILETGWGKSELYQTSYNPAGIIHKGAYRNYGSPEEGLEDMYKLLNSYTNGSISYVGKRNTVKQIRDAWSSAEDTDKILSIWRSIYD